MQRITAIAIALAACLLIGSLAATPTVAQSNGTAFDDVIDVGEESALELGKATITLISSGWDRAKYAAASASPFGGIEQTADQEIETLASTYNANNATLEAYVNNRTTLEQDRTIKLSLHIEETSATRYLEANVTDGNVTESSIVTSTERTVTDEVAVCGYAATQSTEELEHFTEEYATPNEDVDLEYLAELRGSYAKDVDATLLQTSGTCPK